MWPFLGQFPKAYYGALNGAREEGSRVLKAGDRAFHKYSGTSLYKHPSCVGRMAAEAGRELDDERLL
jgi:hypothetical protein